MKRRAMTVLLASTMTLLAAAGASFASGPSFHVSGVVLREDTKTPVARCRLVIRPERQRADRRRTVQDAKAQVTELTTESDPQGRYSFDLPTEGRWQLSASAAGFRTQFYNEHEEFSSAVVVRTGLPLPNLLFSLEPDSSVSGFVHDEAGEAVRSGAILLESVDALPTSAARPRRATTDDRGHYEIDGIAPGSYKVAVQATPWYAAGSRGDGRQTALANSVFDVVYPLTWYPGVLDSATAGVIKVHIGQAAQIDFNLLPLPAAHLRVAGPVGTSTTPIAVPMIDRVESGTPTGISSAVSVVSGQMEFGGISPGLYRVSTSTPDGRSTTAFLHVAAGTSIALGGIDAAGTADVTCRFAESEKPVRAQVVLTDVSSGAMFSSSSRSAFGLRRRTPPVVDTKEEIANERHIAAPVGSFQVTLTGDPDLYLKGLSLRDRPVSGGLIKLAGGPVTLTLYVARGRASLTGRSLLDGKPVEGAMILLVPVNFGEVGSTDLVRRDQSNTDGSYELESIVPGNYILVAIDHGWDVNWHDPATLGRYLLHGIPLTLRPRGKAEEDVSAQTP